MPISCSRDSKETQTKIFFEFLRGIFEIIPFMYFYPLGSTFLHRAATKYSRVQKVHKIWSVWCKMALGEVGVSEISAILPYEIQSFNIDLTFLWNWSFFHYEPKVLDLKKVFSNLEPEGQGHGIIKGVTHLHLLGPFYTIQIKFYVLFCTRL